MLSLACVVQDKFIREAKGTVCRKTKKKGPHLLEEFTSSHGQHFNYLQRWLLQNKHMHGSCFVITDEATNLFPWLDQKLKKRKYEEYREDCDALIRFHSGTNWNSLLKCTQNSEQGTQLPRIAIGFVAYVQTRYMIPEIVQQLEDDTQNVLPRLLITIGTRKKVLLMDKIKEYTASTTLQSSPARGLPWGLDKIIEFFYNQVQDASGKEYVFVLDASASHRFGEVHDYFEAMTHTPQGGQGQDRLVHCYGAINV